MANNTQETNPWQTVRIPLVGINTQRPATAGAFVSGKDQRFVNFIPVKSQNPFTGKEKFFLIKRPGFKAHSTPSAGNICTALHVFEGSGSGTTIISAFGATNSTIYSDTTSKGDITGRARGMIEVDFTGTATVVTASTDSSGWFFPAGGSLTEITDAQYPGEASRTTVGNFVSMDGYLFIMDTTGRIYNSDRTSITSWSGSYIEPTYNHPFVGVGLARHHNTVVAFGTSSFEFLKDVGNQDGSPLGREDAPYKIGAFRPNTNGVTIVNHGDDVYFVGSANVGGTAIYRIRGFKPEVVSPAVVNAQLEVQEPQKATLSLARIWGKSILMVLTNNTSGETFAYNIEDDIWFEMAKGGGGVLWGITGPSRTWDARVFTASLEDTGGKVYEWETDTPVYQDDSDAYTATVQTSKIDFETDNLKRWHKLTLLGDKQAATTTVGVSWADNDYGTFSTARNVDMVNDRTYLTGCGASRRRAIKLTNSTNTPCRLEAIEINYSVCDH